MQKVAETCSCSCPKGSPFHLDEYTPSIVWAVPTQDGKSERATAVREKTDKSVEIQVDRTATHKPSHMHRRRATGATTSGA